MLYEPREVLRAMFDAAVNAASPLLRVPAYLPRPPRGRTIVVGAGKASALMAKAVEDNWPGPLTGLVVTRDDHGVPCSRVEIVEASHPVPDTRRPLRRTKPFPRHAAAHPDEPRRSPVRLNRRRSPCLPGRRWP